MCSEQCMVEQICMRAARAQWEAWFDAAQIPPTVQQFPLRLSFVFMTQRPWQLEELQRLVYSQ